MFYVELEYNNGKPSLGNLEGQGFYQYKRLSSVLKVLYCVRETHKEFLRDCKCWKVYSCHEGNMYSENLPLVTTVPCH